MAGSLIKIDEEIVTSAVASVTLLGIDSTYDVYMIRINNMKSTVDGDDLRIRVTEGGTPNSTANYDFATKFLRTAVAFTNLSATNQTQFDTGNIGNVGGERHNQIMYCFNANNSSEYTFFTNEIIQVASSAEMTGEQGGFVFTSTSTVDGVYFFCNSGNIDTGSSFVLYGLKK